MRYGVVKAQGIDIYHEVLFALSGTRSAFSSHHFALAELFHMSEAILLEKILNIGKDYGKLKEFITSVKSNALTPYLDDVALLEKEIMDQHHCSLNYIWSKMHRHCGLLSGLLSVVGSIDSQKSYGCNILEHLHQVLLSDVGVIKSAVGLIINGVNEIFFRQMTCWLLYGDLLDSQEEFFIKENPVENDDATPFERYSINFAMLPSHIEVSLAEKILNVGQIVNFLRSDPKNQRTNEVQDNRSEICIDKSGLFGEKERKMQEKIAGVRQICKWNDSGRVETLVSEVKSYVTLQLWTLAMQDAKLLDQIRLVSDFFLLGRGELFHEFVTQADKYLSKRSSGNIDFNILLQESARKVLIKEESLQRLSLEFADSWSEDSLEDFEGEWNQLYVKYEAPWPLQLLFTNEVLESYNQIFRFLLRLKKIEVKLGECWLFEKSRRHGQDNLNRRQLHRNLCFLVNNLQYYFHVDVLNSQLMIFETVVETSQDFECIQKAHGVFLENLLSQLFLWVDLGEGKSKNPVRKSINKILELCEEYCYEVEPHIDLEMRDEKITCMLTRFEAFVEFLLNHLTRITSQAIHPSSQHLSQFLLRLDFNSFFSKQFTSTLSSVYL